MRRGSSEGFTAVELAIVLIAIGIIAAIAIPSYLNLVREVRAGQAVADLQAVRAAVYLYYGDHGSWPPEEQAGAIPKGLVPYLPKDMAFFRRDYNLDYENWIVTDGTGGGTGSAGGGGSGDSRSKYPSTGIMIGISVISQDTMLVRTTEGLLANTRIVRMAPKRATLVVADEKGF